MRKYRKRKGYKVHTLQLIKHNTYKYVLMDVLMEGCISMIQRKVATQ